MQFVKIAEVPRMLHRMRHSNTGKEYMWSSKERCGLGWVHFWDEISIEAWVKHANSDGNVSKIAAISD